MRYYPSHKSELLLRSRCGDGKLGKSEACLARQTVRVEELTGRTSDDRRIELRVASTAGIRRARRVVAYADDPESGEPSGVVGIDKQQQRKEQCAQTEKCAAEYG